MYSILPYSNQNKIDVLEHIPSERKSQNQKHIQVFPWCKKCTSKVFERVNTLGSTFGTVFKTPRKIIIGLHKYKSYSTWAISFSILWFEITLQNQQQQKLIIRNIENIYIIQQFIINNKRWLFSSEETVWYLFVFTIFIWSIFFY
jgi:hypothetical protein